MRIGDPTGQALDLYGLGWVSVLTGASDAGLDLFRRSLQVLEERGDPRGQPDRLVSIGEMLRRKGQYEQAAEYFETALRKSTGSGSSIGLRAEALTGLGWAFLAMNQLDSARQSFASAVEIRRGAGDRRGLATAHLGIAHVLREIRAFDEALSNADAAISIIESIRSDVSALPLRLSYFASARDSCDFKIELLMQMHKLNPNGDFSMQSFEVNERSRARSLLESMARAFPDFEASRESVMLPDVLASRILHFATHALVDSELPENSGIVLSMFDRDGKSTDGFVRVSEIYGVGMASELVVLSSCRSAVGRELAGEGAVGLTRAFLNAGARSVVGSLWPTDDKAAADLMVRFYRKMFTGNMRPAVALRAAAIEQRSDKR